MQRMDNDIFESIKKFILDLSEHHNIHIKSMYTAGSINIYELLENLLKLGISDVDVHIVVDDISSKGIFQYRKNRFGTRLIISNVPSVLKMGHYIFDLTFLPASYMRNVEHLLESHDQYAASSNIYYSRVIFDENEFLSNIKKNIVEKFMLRKYIIRRMLYVLSLAKQKLDEFKKEPYTRKLSLKSIWDGPIWGLLSAGNLVITYYGLPPTFRTHLLQVRFLMKRLKIFSEYYRLLDVWGFRRMSKTDILDFLENLRNIYSYVINEVKVEDQVVHSLKYEYWSRGIENMIKNGFIHESGFPIIHVYCRLSYVLRRNNIIKDLYEERRYLKQAYEMLEIMNFDVQNVFQNKLKEIYNILYEYYQMFMSLICNETSK